MAGDLYTGIFSDHREDDQKRYEHLRTFFFSAIFKLVDSFSKKKASQVRSGHLVRSRPNLVFFNSPNTLFFKALRLRLAKHWRLMLKRARGAAEAGG